MVQYRKIKQFYYVPEVTYGVTPTSALTYGGPIVSFKPNVDKQVELHRTSGRDFSDVTRGPYKAGFNIKAKARSVSGGYNWTNLWAMFGMGSASGLADTLGSFTAQTSKVGAATTYNFYNGCKVSKLNISSEGPGKEILFDADVIAQWVQAATTTKAITGLQSLTVGADPTDITTPLLIWNGISQINLGGGLTTWTPRKWSLIVDNHLAPNPENRLGADSVKYPLDAGSLPEDSRDIILEVTLPHEAETYLAAKLADTAITAVTIPIDAKTVTLSNGVFMANDLPELKQGLLEETCKMQFTSLSIA